MELQRAHGWSPTSGAAAGVVGELVELVDTIALVLVADQAPGRGWFRPEV